jgi:ABC-2 type transport system permease protein
MFKFFKRFGILVDARNKEFIRDRSALGWNFLFPILVIFGFAFAFNGGSQDLFKVGLFGKPGASTFFSTQYVQFIATDALEPALAKLKRHQLDMVVTEEGDTTRYWVNSTSPKGYLLEKILAGSASKTEKQAVQGEEIRYIDWLISGLLAMNMMFSALFGVGYVIVRYRKNGVLKRLKATPLSAFEFLLAQVCSRLILIVLSSVAVYWGCNALLHFRMQGSYVDLFIVLVLGAMCLISLGLLLASRVSSEEFAGGLLNLISWPMIFLSGVWFSLEGAHPMVRKAAAIFPLTHVIDAARGIMTEGATLAQLSTHLIVLATMTVVFLVGGAVLFRWE